MACLKSAGNVRLTLFD